MRERSIGGYRIDVIVEYICKLPVAEQFYSTPRCNQIDRNNLMKW